MPDTPSRSKKVLELCLSTGHGGLELYADRVIRHLHAEGRCLAVVAPGTRLASRLESAGIPYSPLRVRARLWPRFAARRLARLMERERVDVLHLHWGKDLNLAVLAKRLCRRPVRLVYSRQMALTRHKRDAYHRFLYSQVDRYTVISRRLYEEAVRFLPLPEDRIRLLYYGVAAPQTLDPEACRGFFDEAGLAEGNFRVALFGRIERGKGQHLLVEAIGQLSSQGLDVRAALVGHVMDQTYFDGLMAGLDEAGLADRVRYLGFHENPPAVMGCFDAVVLASDAETFGLVLIEAMRAGTAVIGTNAGGVPEIIRDGETGLLFEPGDADGLARALARLANAPALCARLAAAGRVEADERFSQERHFAELDAILFD